MHLSGPYSENFGDDDYRPPGTLTVRWYLNDFKVETTLSAIDSDWQKPTLVCLPLQINLPKDYHLIVTLVNTNKHFLDIQIGMQEAFYWVDKIPYESTAARSWNGSYLIRPSHTTLCKFRLGDFPGAPQSGLHEVIIQLFKTQSAVQSINWYPS